MKNTLESIHAHRSIRSYKPDPIPEDVLESVLTAATRASSSGNMQTYSVIVTREEERRKRLWSLHHEQDMIVQAPVLLTFCADWNRMNRWCRARDAKPGHDNFLCFLVAMADAFIAAQNAALAAEAQGLGICYMGTTLVAAGELVEFFDLPRDVFPATTLVLGYPDEEPELRARLPLAGIVHEETYREYSAEEIENTYRERDEEGWARYKTFPHLAEKMRTSGVTNLAQVYTQLKYTKENNEQFSRGLLETLIQQGFLRADDLPS